MIKQDKTEMILNGSIYKVLLTLSIPIMINSIIQTLYNLVDGVYVGMISTVHFAATAFVWPVNFLFISLGIGLSIAGTSLQVILMNKSVGTARFAYNWGLAKWEEMYKEGLKPNGMNIKKVFNNTIKKRRRVQMAI